MHQLGELRDQRIEFLRPIADAAMQLGQPRGSFLPRLPPLISSGATDNGLSLAERLAQRGLLLPKLGDARPDTGNLFLCRRGVGAVPHRGQDRRLQPLGLDRTGAPCCRELGTESRELGIARRVDRRPAERAIDRRLRLQAQRAAHRRCAPQDFAGPLRFVEKLLRDCRSPSSVLKSRSDTAA
jgi:hypothetical protein